MSRDVVKSGYMKRYSSEYNYAGGGGGGKRGNGMRRTDRFRVFKYLNRVATR